MYTNADVKIYEYLRLRIKIKWPRFPIIILFTISDMCVVSEMYVDKHTETIDYVKKWPTF